MIIPNHTFLVSGGSSGLGGACVRQLAAAGANTVIADLNQDLGERLAAELGAGVRFLKDRGYEKIVLVGNSGGAALVSFYQAEAEHPRQLSTPAGDPVELGTLLPADGIVLCAAHAGRARLTRGGHLVLRLERSRGTVRRRRAIARARQSDRGRPFRHAPEPRSRPHRGRRAQRAPGLGGRCAV